jgi:hypothetical protein
MEIEKKGHQEKKYLVIGSWHSFLSVRQGETGKKGEQR